MRIFVQDQGNQGITRRRTVVRRTRNPADWRRGCAKRPFMSRRLTQRLRKKAIYGWKLAIDY